MLTPVDLRQVGFDLKTVYHFQEMSMQQTDLLLCVLNSSDGFLAQQTDSSKCKVRQLCQSHALGEMRIRPQAEIEKDIDSFLTIASKYSDKNSYHSVIVSEHLVYQRKVSDVKYVNNVFKNIPEYRLVWQPPVTELYWAYVCFNFINHYHSKNSMVNKSLGGEHNLTLARIMGYYGEHGANLKNLYSWRPYTDISISVMEFVLRNKIAELTEVLQYFWPDINTQQLNQYIDFLNTDNIPNFQEWYKNIDDDERTLIHHTVEQNKAYSNIVADTATITPDNYREILRKYTR